jgi:type II secretory pathway component PulM
VRPIATHSPAITPRELRLLAAAAGIALISALVVLGGQAAFRKPAPALSAEQEQALQRADKLEKALQTLDPKLRAQLPADLRK